MEEGKGKIRKAKKSWEVETFEHVNDRKAVVSFYFILFYFGKSLEEFEGAKTVSVDFKVELELESRLKEGLGSVHFMCKVKEVRLAVIICLQVCQKM